MLKSSLIRDCCLPSHIDHVDIGQRFADGVIDNRARDTQQQKFPTELELAERSQYEGIADKRAGELGIIHESGRTEFAESRRDCPFVELFFTQAVDDLFFGSRTHSEQTQGGVLCGEERLLGDEITNLRPRNLIAHAQSCTKEVFLAEADQELSVRKNVQAAGSFLLDFNLCDSHRSSAQRSLLLWRFGFRGSFGFRSLRL